MIILIVIGVVSFLFAIALFFFPDQLKKMNEMGNQILFTDERAIVYRKIAGILLLLLSFLFFFIGYYITNIK
ncbi:MAG: hypothetical protein KAI43_12455 [Candidatus Aureabacteria bacterium]|nr:hypothetical protein [Candidatus Auribacterota bacterium]